MRASALTLGGFSNKLPPGIREIRYARCETGKTAPFGEGLDMKKHIATIVLAVLAAGCISGCVADARYYDGFKGDGIRPERLGDDRQHRKGSDNRWDSDEDRRDNRR